MKIVVAGCRDYNNYPEAKEFIEVCLAELQLEEKGIILSGKCSGQNDRHYIYEQPFHMYAKLAKRLTYAKSVLLHDRSARSKWCVKCRFFVGQKCVDKVFNYICNCMKLGILAFKIVGQKYVKILCDSIADSEKITTFASH